MGQEEEKQTSTGEHTADGAPAQNQSMQLLDAEKNMRELTNIELIKKAEESVERLKLERAVSLYDEGIKRFPNDTLIMD